MLLKQIFLQWKRLTQISTLINQMKIDESLMKKHNKVKHLFLQLNKSQNEKIQLRYHTSSYGKCVIEKIIKSDFDEKQLQINENIYVQLATCEREKGQNEGDQELCEQLISMQTINENVERQAKRRKLIKAANYYNHRILSKSFKSLRINEKQSKQEFLEKIKMTDEKEQKFLTNQKELQKNLMADAFHSSKLLLKSFLNWKKYIFQLDQQDFYFSQGTSIKISVVYVKLKKYGNSVQNGYQNHKQNLVNKTPLLLYKQNVDNFVTKQQQSEKVTMQNSSDNKSEYCIMLEYKIQFYQKHSDQLTSFQKEILKKEICQLKQYL